MGTRMQLLGSLTVGAGGLLMVLALTGVGNDWLGGHLIDCGGRYLHRPCEPGEIPWRAAFQGFIVAVIGVAMLAAAAQRGGRVGDALRSARGAVPPVPGAGRPGSVPPPAPRTAPAPLDGAAARKPTSVPPPGAKPRGGA